MILSSSQENSEWTRNNYKIYVPRISKHDVCFTEFIKENDELDLDIKIWIKKYK